MSIKRPYTLAPVRVSAEEKEAVEQAAKSLNLSVAMIVRALPQIIEAGLRSPMTITVDGIAVTLIQIGDRVEGFNP